MFVFTHKSVFILPQIQIYNDFYLKTDLLHELNTSSFYALRQQNGFYYLALTITEVLDKI